MPGSPPRCAGSTRPRRPRRPVPSPCRRRAGERTSFEAVCRTGDLDYDLSASAGAPEELMVHVRRVDYVPMPHHTTERKTPLEDLEGVGHIPGYVPDPLFPEAGVHAGPHETHALWVTVQVPADVAPGRFPVTVTMAAASEEPVTLTATVVVHPALLPPRRAFPVTHWLYADALCEWYRVAPFEEAFWCILDPSLANVVAHGQDTLRRAAHPGRRLRLARLYRSARQA